MNSRSFQNHIISLGENLMSGDIIEITKVYKSVVPFFVEGKATLIDGSDALLGAIENLRERFISEGVTRIVGSLVDDEKMDKDRFRFTIDWHYHLGLNDTKMSTVVYYCVRENGAEMIEMVEYQRLAFPNIIGWKSLEVTKSIPNKNASSRYLH